MVSLAGAAGALVWSGLGAVVAWNGWTAHVDERERVDNAVEVRAEIVDVGASETQERVDVEGGGTTTRTRYVPWIAFEYEIDGESYTANNVEPPSEGVDATRKYGSESRAREHLDDYEAGETVTAYVDPAAPAEGFLERETNALRNLGSVAVGGILVLTGIAFLIVAVV